MSKSAPMNVYLEAGSKRVFACALDWPGWSRSGRHEEDALEALLAYGPRYAGAVRGAVRPAFHAPRASTDLRIVGRVKGDATTDFGAPSIAPAADAGELDAKAFARVCAILRASWSAFDRAAAGAEGVELAKGPRGGGRDLDAIVAHVVNAEAAYTGHLAARRPGVEEANAADAVEEYRIATLDALDRGFADGLPAAGPRGGKIWTIPYFVRRAAWHVLDHAWEIEDRAS